MKEMAIELPLPHCNLLLFFHTYFQFSIRTVHPIRCQHPIQNVTSQLKTLQAKRSQCFQTGAPAPCLKTMRSLSTTFSNQHIRIHLHLKTLQSQLSLSKFQNSCRLKTLQTTTRHTRQSTQTNRDRWTCIFKLVQDGLDSNQSDSSTIALCCHCHSPWRTVD